MLRLIAPTLALLAIPSAVLAHVTAVAHEEPGWTLTPTVLVPIAAALVLYVVGTVRLLRRSRTGRAELRRRFTWFAAGWLTLATAAITPLHEAGEMSFALHMIEHELLMLLAAPLLVLARPLGILLWGCGMRTRRMLAALVRVHAVNTTWRVLHSAVLATALQAAVMWLWHVPQLFQRALLHEGWHIAQHLSFLASALLFWSAMFREGQRRAGVASLCLFVTSLIGGALGALMTFAASPWYPSYAAMGLTPFGLTAQEDQQLAGLLMWIPGGLVHAGVALALILKVLRMPAGADTLTRYAVSETPARPPGADSSDRTWRSP